VDLHPVRGPDEVLGQAQERSIPDGISIKLGPVGGRIVAGVFAALLRGDPTSYLYSDPPFEPIPKLAPKGRFGLAEVINAALRPTP